MKIVKNLKSIIIVVSILVFMIVAYIIFATFFEPKAYNFMVQNFSAKKHGSDEIVIIAIDDKSISDPQRGIRWPWKRALYADIFEYLGKYSKAKLIGFDVVIATPDTDRNSDLKFYSAVSKMNNLVVGFAPSTLPYDINTAGDNYDKDFKSKFSVNIKDQRSTKSADIYKSLLMFPKDYFNAVKKVGSIEITSDSDGYIRYIDQFINYKGTLYPSLALRMYDFMLPKDNTFVINDTNVIATKSNLSIPVSDVYNTGIFNNIRFYSPYPNGYTHKTYSAIDILDSLKNIKQGKPPIISPEVFKDKIVFVGGNAKAIAIGLTDVKRTPVSGDFPGVDIQATNLDNIMHNEFLVQTNTFQDVLNLIILLGATFLVIRFLSLAASLGIISLLIVGYLFMCAVLYELNIAINVITPIALQLITMTMAYSYRFILEGRNKEKIKHAMGRYISQDVMQNVVNNIDSVGLGGKRANVTVLFADIRGFTSMSENLSAEEVSVILNEYFTEIEPIIAKYNGVINKFIGDAVMAIFGEPIQDKNHALNAVKCANAMLKKVNDLQKKWLDEGKPKIEIGIGINTGEAFVGNIGSEKRLEYTVIGDVVNLASRIESYNKVYKTSFLISSTTYEKVRNIADVIKISEVSIRGKAKKLDIYEVLRLVGK